MRTSPNNIRVIRERDPWPIPSPTSTSTPSSRCSTGRRGSTSWWPRRPPTASRRSGITDHGNMYGRPRLLQGVPQAGHQADHRHRGLHGPRPPQRASRRGAAGVDDSGGDTEGGKKLYYHLTLLAENQTGYKNLIQLSSLAFLEGYYYKPRIDWELLDEVLRRAHRHHRLPRRARAAVAAERRREGRRREGRLACRTSSARDNLFVELQDHGLPGTARDQPEADRDREEDRRAAARHQRQPLHAPARTTRPTTRCCACRPARCCRDPKRFKFEGNEHYLKSAAEMRYLFREVPEACDNTLWIAERADVEIEFGKPQLPELPACPRGSTTTPRTSSTSPWRGPRSGGATSCPTTRSSGSATSSRSSTTWGSRRTS